MDTMESLNLRCSICGYRYNMSSKADCGAHYVIHKFFLERSRKEALKVPMSRIAREEVYRKGINLIKQKDFASRYRGSLLLVERDFQQSLHEAAINGYYDLHPDFRAYLSMVFESYSQIPDDLKDLIREKIGQCDRVIAPNYIHWYPEGSNARENQFKEYEANHKRRRPLSLHAAAELGLKKHY